MSDVKQIAKTWQNSHYFAHAISSFVDSRVAIGIVESHTARP